MRQDQRRTLAELQLRADEANRAVLESQVKIAEATQQVAADHKSLFERSDSVQTKFALAFLALAFVTLVMGLLPLAYPEGVPWVVERAPGGTEGSPTQPASGPAVSPNE